MNASNTIKPDRLFSRPLGARMPESVHAVACSLPTMRDVIGYEEKSPEVLQAVKSGYPRFVTHFYVRQVASEICRDNRLIGRECFVSASEVLARETVAFAREPDAAIVEADGLFAAHFPAGSDGVARARSFMQHVGGGISSRRAEAFLLNRGALAAAHPEERAETASAGDDVRRRTAELFGTGTDHVILSASGMNAFYAVFRAIDSVQRERGRTDWIQLGWLYLDTIEILKKMTGGESIYLPDVLDLGALEARLSERAGRVAGIVTEAPTNPLIQTADMARLRALADRFGIPLIVDPTLASPWNIDVLPFCDVAINSLTKYAANRGDVMLGAAILNPASAWADPVRDRASRWIAPPFEADLSRLALEMRDYRPVMTTINANALALAEFLEGHPGVEKVFTPYTDRSGKNYAALTRRPDSPGGIISIRLRRPLEEFYDRIQAAKGPSFGMTFTILCPFLYLAHYDLVSTKEGRDVLRASGIDPDLIRISVGTEPSDQIIATFEEALR